MLVDVQFWPIGDIFINSKPFSPNERYVASPQVKHTPYGTFNLQRTDKAVAGWVTKCCTRDDAAVEDRKVDAIRVISDLYNSSTDAPARSRYVTGLRPGMRGSHLCQ